MPEEEAITAQISYLLLRLVPYDLPVMLYTQMGSRSILDIFPRLPNFYQNDMCL
jgi:hypothetical protein